jgi:hypothetical protein
MDELVVLAILAAGAGLYLLTEPPSTSPYLPFPSQAYPAKKAKAAPDAAAAPDTAKGGKTPAAPAKGGKGAAPEAPAAPASGGSAPTGKTGCTSGVYGSGPDMQAKDSGKSTRHFASGGSQPTTEWNVEVSWPAVEGVLYVTPGSCGDNTDIKLWGPHHSGGACCWCLASIEWKDGSVYFGGEGPHPKTNKTQQKIGTVKKAATVGLLFAIWPGAGGAHQECWVDEGAGWRKVGQRDGPCGNGSKETTPKLPMQVQFRTDCKVGYKCAYARQITGKGGGGGAAAAKVARIQRSPFAEIEYDIPEVSNYAYCAQI